MNKLNRESALNQLSNRKKPRKLLMMTIIASVVASASTVPANAAKYRHTPTNSSAHHNGSFDYAKVLNVKPIVERYQVNQPQEQCWDERVPVRSHYNNRSTHTKTPHIVGAIIGGIVGNQIGKRGGGNARDVATVAGAVLGGSIGRDHNSRNHGRYERTQYETVQRCEITDSYVTQEQVVAYKVKYQYRGEVFHTQMAEHPGRKIKVRVSVQPV